MGEIEISAVSFVDEGIAIQYIEVPTDVRVEGRVVLGHQIQLHATHPDYRDDIRNLHERVVKVVRNALEDFHNSLPYEPERDDDDDERGMGE